MLASLDPPKLNQNIPPNLALNMAAYIFIGHHLLAASFRVDLSHFLGHKSGSHRQVMFTQKEIR